MDEPQIEEPITEKKKDFLVPASIILVALIIGYAWLYQKSAISTPSTGERSEENTAPAIELPAAWGNLGAQMVAAGVIDREKFVALYDSIGGLSEKERNLLDGTDNGNLKITSENSGFVLNLLWALGLGNKNKILEEGPMANPRYGDPGRFASTGGWTIAKGNAMNHYSKHLFIVLTTEQQALVEKVSKNIYRPCCDNPTYFPDCNHGMAMLGLLELLASQGTSESEIYKLALQVNAFWFPEQYATIARYLESKGRTLQTVDPKEILGNKYSGASGFSRIAALVPQVERQSGGGCGV